jgi:DNA-binding transcriptional ArsR family regulator
MIFKMRVAQKEGELDDVFFALADRTRRRIIARLARGSATMGELAAPLPMTVPAVSKHLRVLERAGLVRRERDGWFQRCHLETAPMNEAAAFIAKYRPFWAATLEALAAHVEKK